MTPSRILWYFADPMCSWCWGFSPVIEAIRETYADQVKVALMLGGLRPGTTEPMTAEMREEILHHWHQVQQRSGQAFVFENAMPAGFIYDTEPPSRAVIAVAEINPEATFPYFTSVQAAFYAHGQDVTQTQTLTALVETQHIKAPQFLERYHSADVQTKTLKHFQIARQAGVRGFPTVLMQDASGTELLTNGYREFEELRPEIDAWLARPG